MPPSLIDRMFVLLQHALPQHTLSALMYRLARCRQPWVAHGLIRVFSCIYRVNLAEADTVEVRDYPSFNAFFTRALKPEARPITRDPKAIVSPADGAISQIGPIDDAAIVQAKGQRYDVTTLLGGDSARAAPFLGGRFATIYLSPKDYHRLHMPLAGRLREMVYLPGRLFSVNEATAALVPALFTRNERVVTLFDTDAGPMALVLVGAIFVGSIETVWHGEVTPRSGARRPENWGYAEEGPRLERGAEMGRFNMGSTVIVLFGPGVMEWTGTLGCGDAVRIGQPIGERI